MKIPKIFSYHAHLVYTGNPTNEIKDGAVLEIYDQVWSEDHRIFTLGLRLGHAVVKSVDTGRQMMTLDIFFFGEMLRTAGLEETILNSTMMPDDEDDKAILSVFCEGTFNNETSPKIKEIIADDRLRRFLS